jgi:hypothetical protein
MVNNFHNSGHGFLVFIIYVDEIAVLQKKDKATLSRWLKKYDEHLAESK